VDKKKVIAVFIPSLAGGGAERGAIFIADILDQAGYDVDLIYACNHGPLLHKDTVRKLGVSLDAANEMLCLPHLVRYLKRRKPDLIIAIVHSAKIMAGLARYFAPGTRLAISVRNNLLTPRKHRFWPRRFFGYGFERRLYAHAVGAHSVSRELAEQTIRCFGIPPEKSFCIYNPINESHFHPAIQAGHNSLFDRPVILSAGRLVAQKDHAALIRCFAASGLAETCRLVILGEGRLRPSLERQIKELKLEEAVALPGHVPDIRPYLDRAAGFALSSRFEGLVHVLLEALRACRDIGGWQVWPPCAPRRRSRVCRGSQRYDRGAGSQPIRAGNSRPAAAFRPGNHPLALYRLCGALPVAPRRRLSRFAGGIMPLAFSPLADNSLSGRPAFG